jgi:hypothetical protein
MRPEDVEVAEVARRRRYTAEFKREILRKADACTQPGEFGALLRAKGLYSSHLTTFGARRRSGGTGRPDAEDARAEGGAGGTPRQDDRRARAADRATHGTRRASRGVDRGPNKSRHAAGDPGRQRDVMIATDDEVGPKLGVAPTSSNPLSLTLKTRPYSRDSLTPIGSIKTVTFWCACARAWGECGPESANVRRFGVNGDNHSPRMPRIRARFRTCLGRIPRHVACRTGLPSFSMHGPSEAEEPALSEDVAPHQSVRTIRPARAVSRRFATLGRCFAPHGRADLSDTTLDAGVPGSPPGLLD